jgi:hypothetical protein
VLWTAGSPDELVVRARHRDRVLTIERSGEWFHQPGEELAAELAHELTGRSAGQPPRGYATRTLAPIRAPLRPDHGPMTGPGGSRRATAQPAGGGCHRSGGILSATITTGYMAHRRPLRRDHPPRPGPLRGPAVDRGPGRRPRAHPPLRRRAIHETLQSIRGEVLAGPAGSRRGAGQPGRLRRLGSRPVRRRGRRDLLQLRDPAPFRDRRRGHRTRVRRRPARRPSTGPGPLPLDGCYPWTRGTRPRYRHAGSTPLPGAVARAGGTNPARGSSFCAAVWALRLRGPAPPSRCWTRLLPQQGRLRGGPDHLRGPTRRLWSSP